MVDPNVETTRPLRPTWLSSPPSWAVFGKGQGLKRKKITRINWNGDGSNKPGREGIWKKARIYPFASLRLLHGLYRSLGRRSFKILVQARQGKDESAARARLGRGRLAYEWYWYDTQRFC